MSKHTLSPPPYPRPGDFCGDCAQPRECLFCRPGDPENRLAPEVPKLGGCYVRLDNHPAFPGHVEIVPYRHVARLSDLTERESTGMRQLVVYIADVWFPEHYGTNAYNIGGNVGEAAGQSQPHAHLHVIPRSAGDVADPLGGVRAAFPNFAPHTW
ncbi:HIT domain-containing protein (plasmid) [Embleya sp. NBC_00888]|uniref:HIT family protein n=1 Tax=Embleya sp. NBC_00888 TaxID=2975960 RepID=UPI003868CA58|nr:HIT domain-containing protein [Embleya sp. NBC_00888]